MSSLVVAPVRPRGHAQAPRTGSRPFLDPWRAWKIAWIFKKNSMNTYQWILINVIQSYTFFEVFCVNVWGRYLVGGFNHLEKYESQWEGLSHMAHIYIYIMENNPHVPNHQPDNEIEYPWDPLDENPNGLWSSKSNTQNGVMKNCGSS